MSQGSGEYIRSPAFQNAQEEIAKLKEEMNEKEKKYETEKSEFELTIKMLRMELDKWKEQPGRADSQVGQTAR